jgi:hypothetical protein
MSSFSYSTPELSPRAKQMNHREIEKPDMFAAKKYVNLMQPIVW